MARPRVPRNEGLFRRYGLRFTYPEFKRITYAVGRSKKHLTISELIRAAIDSYLTKEGL